jgi:predicted O-linked N-acetylglucosamine transferase (SPINDLY family)
MEGPRALEELMDRARSLMRDGDRDGAWRLYVEATVLEPGHAGAWFMRGVAEAERRDVESARSSIGRAFQLDARQPAQNRLVLANVLLDSADPDGAEREARAALDLKPAWPPALATLAQALMRQRRMEEAIAACRAALTAQPGYERGRDLLATVLWLEGRSLHQATRIVDAIDHYRESLALDGRDADRWNDLGIAYTDAGLLTEAQASYRAALERKPDYHQVASNVLVVSHYDAAVDPGAMFRAHRDWAERYAAGVPLLEPARERPPDARLRVGFLSPALRTGPTGAFLEPLLAHLDRDRVRIHAYRVAGSADATTQRLRGHCDAWHDLLDRNDEEIARVIRDDALDVLVDLAGHAPGGRLLVLARKPAPVIVTWLDYFDTTGLDAVDYLIGDPVSTPPGGAQEFSEKVLAISPCRLCFAAPPDSPPVVAPPASRGRPFTFGSFNRYAKIGPEVVRTWARILQAVPASRLLLKSDALADPRLHEQVRERFAAHGIDAARLELRGPSPHAQMLAEYGDIDIALDTFPYNGGLTTCEALWMGVPVLALLGSSMISRQSASLLRAAGLEDWIAQSPDDYVRLAAERAGNGDALATLRRGMREQVGASPLMDAPAFAAKLARLLADIAAAG